MVIQYTKLENFWREFLKPMRIEKMKIKQRNVPININMKLYAILFSLFPPPPLSFSDFK
jgi:hypothetical protein